ncbi:MAG: LUD domain-containing protein [Spirosomataceae bacterium]
MSSRDDILKAIKAIELEPISLPQSLRFTSDFGNLETHFTQVLASIGGQVEQVSSLSEIPERVAALHPTAKWVIDAVTQPFETISNPKPLEAVDVAIIKGELGVAENAAIWVKETSLPHRVLPFICQHLVMVIPKQSLVANLHDAYLQIDTKQLGYGVLIAGPSKTADIEQSLVIGAHGARSLIVFLLDSDELS